MGTWKQTEPILQKASRVSRLDDAPDLGQGQGPPCRKQLLGDHAGQVGGMAESLPFQHKAGAAAQTGVQPVVAQPAGPLPAAGLEMGAGKQDTPVEVALVGDRRGEERGIEHLKRDIGAGDAHTVEFTDFATGTAAGHYPEGFAQIVGYRLQAHALQYRVSG